MDLTVKLLKLCIMFNKATVSDFNLFPVIYFQEVFDRPLEELLGTC